MHAPTAKIVIYLVGAVHESPAKQQHPVHRFAMDGVFVFFLLFILQKY